MCQICVDYQKGLLTLNEAFRNANELQDDQHYEDVIIMLLNDLEIE